MGIDIVRKTSVTPNINNTDDVIPFRYAYGNQDGYVVGIGNELSATYESGTFTVNSGRAVIQGVDVKIDGNGASVVLDTTTGVRYFKIYLKVNLDSENAEIVSYYSNSSYSDITEPQSGELISGNTAYMLLYTLKLNGSIQTELNKIVKAVDYTHRRLLWSGNAEIGTTNPQQNTPSFATIPAKENTTYEIQGEIVYNDPTGYIKPTFSIKFPIGASNQDGYKTKQILDANFDTYGNTAMVITKVDLIRNGNYFYGNATKQRFRFVDSNISYDEISVVIKKIYEVE